MHNNSRLTMTLIITSLLLIVTAAAHAAGDADAGRDKARACAACHGMDGQGRVPLAGKTAGELEELLRDYDYQSGARRGQTMNAIARQLSDEDIADLAAYYAAQ